ncbi:MAG: PHP domain-containing protein [Candidatus Omnitrophica bacterium]|nr:PHP domain-containing protein [Candidatus Omnitrophota bacterium]
MKSKNSLKIISFLVCSLWICSSCTFVIRTPAFTPPKNQKPHLFRGVVHVHTEYSHDSKAPLALIIKTAKKAGLDFVVVTDHNNLNALRTYQKMNLPNHPLLIFGDEISTWNEGHLIGLGIKEEPHNTGNTQGIVDFIHGQEGYAIIAHPLSPRKPWPNWDVQHFDGLEVFCFSDTFYAADPRSLSLKALFFTPRGFIKSVLENPDAGLKLWDEHLKSGRHVAAFGSTDAHLKFYWHGLYAENLLLYFQTVTMYVQAKEFKAEKIVESLGRGKSFIAFEIYGPAQDFSFSALVGNKVYEAGDVVLSELPIQFVVKTPKTAQIKLIHNGSTVKEGLGTTLEYETQARGYWRSEVYVDGKLWIISNPIYVTD